ncbi:L,D-transpeptidase [Prosthecobacter sp.]|uniref:L,D-transpeptidase n=1 Tax=Prosthecobacter sp. TaxID=1965333 RepID=UPI0037845703
MHRFLVLLLTLASCAHMHAPVTLPPEISAVLPQSCKQVLYVTAADSHTTAAEVRILERTSSNTWQSVSAPILARIGRNGLAWGHGEFALSAPAGFRTKREGDGCAPVGIFRIPQAFGSDPKPSAIKLPYIHCTPHHWGIDDVRSKHYNQIVDDRIVPCDWTGPETMIPGGSLYKLGAEIAHNPRRTPGLGSCIFLHIWLTPDTPTAGCTAMSESDLLHILTWLDPSAEPCLVQWVSGAQ